MLNLFFRAPRKISSFPCPAKARSGGKLIVNPTPWLAGNRPTGQELRRAIDVGNLAEFIFRTMTEIWFYHLQRQPLESVLPNLLEKSLEKGWRVAVQARSEERLDALDSWLWTYSDESFLAHGRARDGDSGMQPVYLTAGIENPNGAALRLFVEGAEMPPALAEASAPYARVVVLFDGNNAEELALARTQWKKVLVQGFSATYWQQNESGRWEKKS